MRQLKFMAAASAAMTLAFALSATPIAAAEYNTGPTAIIQCPTKDKMNRNLDLSTGVAPWVVSGPGIPNGKARATPIDPKTIPQGWTARLPGARWVQGQPVSAATAHAPGDYLFTLSFQVKKAKRMPRLTLHAQVITDEAFDINLLEPSGPGQDIGAGGGGSGDDAPETVSREDEFFLALSHSADASGKRLGHRAGIYRLELRLKNSAAPVEMLGMLAKVELKAICGAEK